MLNFLALEIGLSQNVAAYYKVLGMERRITFCGKLESRMSSKKSQEK